MRNFNKKDRKKILSFIFLILIILLINLFRNNVRQGFYLISNPVQEKLWKAGILTSNFLEGILNAGSLKAKSDILEAENGELRAKIILLAEISEENKELKEALGLNLNLKYKLILGYFISKDIDQDIVLVNRGARDGVKEDDPVVTSGGIVVGKVKEVYPKYCKVFLISNKKLSFDVRIKHENKDILAVAEGKGNLSTGLRFISQTESISDGDMVFTDSLGNIFPESLAVGKVKHIIKTDLSPFQEAEIEPFFKLEDTRGIFVISDII